MTESGNEPPFTGRDVGFGSICTDISQDANAVIFGGVMKSTLRGTRQHK